MKESDGPGESTRSVIMLLGFDSRSRRCIIANYVNCAASRCALQLCGGYTHVFT